MKRILDGIALLLYAVCLYLLWQLCRLGGLRHWLTLTAPFAILFLLCLLAKLVLRLKGSQAISFKIRLGAVVLITLFFGTLIAYEAVPYHGALAWKLDDWLNHKQVVLIHHNLYERRMEGILEDVGQAFKLPDELYVADDFSVEFKADGTIVSVDALIYGLNRQGKTESFLLAYDGRMKSSMDVWRNRAADLEINPDKALRPFSKILEQAAYEDQVAIWSLLKDTRTYGLLFSGRETVNIMEGTHFLTENANEGGLVAFAGLTDNPSAGGQVRGYTASLYLPEEPAVEPVCYVLNPDYISPEKLSLRHDEEMVETAKSDPAAWTVDESEGTVYTFVRGDDSIGYRLLVKDAAAGSRFYSLERSRDGGSSWETCNENPFLGAVGVAEGIEFFDENLGFIGIQGAAGEHSSIYVTRDGGRTFAEVQLPLDQVTNLPEEAKTYGLSLADYRYLLMPVYEGDKLLIQVTPGAEETVGLSFYSEDDGVSWQAFP